MNECVVEPFRGVLVQGRGLVPFGSTLAEIEEVLGAAVVKPSWDGSASHAFYQDEVAGVCLRLAFPSGTGRCEAIEFLAARDFPPTLRGQRLAGPSMYRAASDLTQRGCRPWARSGPITDLAAACREHPPDEPQPDDTIYFHDIGLCLWTDTDTVLGEDGTTAWFLLDTVLVWQAGYLQRQNEAWERAGYDLNVRLPEAEPHTRPVPS